MEFTFLDILHLQASLAVYIVYPFTLYLGAVKDYLETHSKIDCSSLAKKSFPRFCDVLRFLFRFWAFELIELRGWRPQNPARSKSTIMRLPLYASYNMLRGSASQWRTRSLCNSVKAVVTASTTPALFP